MGHQRYTVRLSVRWRGLRPPVVLARGTNGLETHTERRLGRVQFPWELQFLLDAVPGAEVSREFRPDGDEEASPGPDHSVTPGYQCLLHRSFIVVGSMTVGRRAVGPRTGTGQLLTAHHSSPGHSERLQAS